MYLGTGMLDWIARMANAAFESQVHNKYTYSASAEDIEGSPAFMDDTADQLSPPRNCMPPDVLYVNRDKARLIPKLKKHCSKTGVLRIPETLVNGSF
ncbi:hypothetical protein Tco_0922098 [Tanacetum coccineum]|uniref:Uncharacterized protein n=1 Tax=Tanacetum coccineum TaxID=301880 RepID=A0ABQ5D3L7_9ASTR